MNQVELFLFDCKHMDPDEHKRLTGLDNVLILQNLHALFAVSYTHLDVYKRQEPSSAS